MVYQYKYSPDHTLNGYLNFTLSYFDPKHFETQGDGGDNNLLSPKDIIHPKHCRYRDFRHPPWESEKYHETDAFWHVLAARLAFVVVFQNCVALVVMAIKWIVPNVKSDIEDRCRREAYVTNEVIIRSELLKAKGVFEVNDRINVSKMDISLDQPREDSTVTQELMMKSMGDAKHDFEHDSNMRRRNIPTETESKTDVSDLDALRKRIEKQMTGDITDGNIVV